MMFSPRLPPRLNLTGMPWPALTWLSVGGLSTGWKKPLNGNTAGVLVGVLVGVAVGGTGVLVGVGVLVGGTGVLVGVLVSVGVAVAGLASKPYSAVRS